jgi:hypothetical protein
MTKNLLFLSDKLPKPNYDKQFKNTKNGIDENKNYRSFSKVNNNKVNDKDEIEEKDFNKGIHIKKPSKLAPLQNVPEDKVIKNLINNENNKQEGLKNNINNSHSMNELNKVGDKLNNNIVNNIIVSKSNNSLNNNNKIILKKDEMYYVDILSKQKNDLRKMMLKNSNISRRIGYLNGNNQMNSSPIKDLNKIFMVNINNKSAPKKINSNKILKNKYYIQSPSYLNNVEKYHENLHKLDYDYKNNYNNNNVNPFYKEGPENKVVPKIPRRLNPIKKTIPNII